VSFDTWGWTKKGGEEPHGRSKGEVMHTPLSFWRRKNGIPKILEEKSEKRGNPKEEGKKKMGVGVTEKSG